MSLQPTLRCPDHHVDLEWRPSGDVIKGLRCPAERDSMLSTANRWCSRCGARDASWMSGTCDSCYRAMAKAEDQQQKEWADNYAARKAIAVAIEHAATSGDATVAAWLSTYKETLP